MLQLKLSACFSFFLLKTCPFSSIVLISFQWPFFSKFCQQSLSRPNVSVIATVVLSGMQSESGEQVETVQADQQLPQAEEEGDIFGMLLGTLVVKLDRDSGLMKALHTKLQPQETGSRKGVQDVTEHCFEEND